MGAAKPAPDAQLRNRARTEQEYEQRTRRIALLRTLDCLHTVPLEELEYLVGLCTLRGFLAYETIVEAGNQGRYLYVLLQGSVRLTLRDREGNEVLLGMLSRGDVYGEESLFGTFFRRMGAYCETHCYVLQLPLADVRALLPAAPALHKVLQRVYQQRLAECTLARVPLFSHLTPTERLALLPLLKARHFPRDTEVMRQGEQGEALCLIESGRLLVQRDGDTISLMDEGDFCGEMALLSDKCHTATVRTLTPTDALMLPASEFHQLLGKRPNLARRFEQMLERRRAMDASLADDRQRVERLELAVQHGLLRGGHLLVHTPELCPPGCHACEQACEARHGHVRLDVGGVQVGDYTVVDTCRQCQVGAECAEACPYDAFEWNDGGALVITDRCTGCGDCVPACPYDAVQRVPRHNQTHNPLKLLLRTMQRARRAVRPVIPLEPVEYTHRADKCDLCHSYDDMACVSQCPSGALRLVPVEEVLPL